MCKENGKSTTPRSNSDGTSNEQTRRANVREQNQVAFASISNIVKSSLGPISLDKMIVDGKGEITATNDGATLLKLLEIRHPAAKILVELADLQDSEVGDGTTSVVIIASELLTKGNKLVKQKIHPTTIIQGFRLATRESVKYIEKKLAISVKLLGRQCLYSCAKTALNSKMISIGSDLFAQLVVDVALSVESNNSSDDSSHCPLESVNVVKVHGSSTLESRRLIGCGINIGRAAQSMPTSIKEARVACLDFDLRKSRMRTGIQVLVKKPLELESIRTAELDYTKRNIELILKTGANVVMTTKGVDDMALKYLVEAGVLGCRRVSREDMRRIAEATGAKIIVTLADMDGCVTFSPKWLGFADIVYEDNLADNSLIIFQNCRNGGTATILLRGANEYILDETERSVHDALCVIKKVLEGSSIVAGGGAVEAALFVFLQSFAASLGSREQLAVLSFSDALLVIPKTLAVNAGKDATDLVAKLCSYHYASQRDFHHKQSGLVHYGLDLESGVIRDNILAGVLEPLLSKTKMIQFAADAANTILRIDDLILMDDPAKKN